MQDLNIHRMHRFHSTGILRSQSAYGGIAITPQGVEYTQVGGDTCPARRIETGDGQADKFIFVGFIKHVELVDEEKYTRKYRALFDVDIQEVDLFAQSISVYSKHFSCFALIAVCFAQNQLYQGTLDTA